MRDSVFSYRKRLVVLLVFVSIVSFTPLFLGVNVFIKASSDEVINSWYENEKISIQQGNILSSVTKLQRSIPTSVLVKSIKVSDSFGRDLVNFGKENINIQKNIFNERQKNKISSYKLNFYETIYTFSSGDLTVFILTGSFLSVYLLAGILIYLVFLLGIFGLIVRKETITEEKIKSEIEISRISLNLEMSEKVNSIATQVSHDIRSPLEALTAILEETNEISTDRRIVMINAIQRINGIANDLLISNKKHSPPSQLNLAKEELFAVIESLVLEKRMQLKGRPEVLLEFFFKPEKKLLVNINKIEFQRTLSNLINNSIEAIKDNGKIIISVSDLNENVSILISDTGHGIPTIVLENIGTKGLTFGKEGSLSGLGLGIYHAKETIQSCNGLFSIESQVGYGTTISILLPKISISQISSLVELGGRSNNISFYDYVYIDDEELLLLSWSLKAKRKNINLLLLKSTKDFKQYSSLISKKRTYIYIDSDLGKEEVEGEKFALELHEQGYEKIFIASAYESNRFAHLTWLNYAGKRCPL